MIKKILFMHIPKCGGRSIRHSIVNSLELTDSEYTRINSPNSAFVANLLGQDLYKTREILLAYFVLNPEIRFVSGHIQYSSLIKNICNDLGWMKAALLREPRKRFISQYFYNWIESGRRNINSPITDPLDKFLCTERARREGMIYIDYLSPETKNENLEIRIEHAINALDEFDLIGVTENMKDFERKFQNLFGRKLTVPVINTNPVAFDIQQKLLTDEALEKINLLCEPSRVVYDFLLRKLRLN